MKQWIVSAASVTLVGVVFLVLGYRAGAVHAATGARFVRVSDTVSFDTKTGQNCDTDETVSDGTRSQNGITPPKGLRLDSGRPLCSELR